MGLLDKALQSIKERGIVLKKSISIDKDIPDIRKQLKNAMDRGKVVAVLQDVDFVLNKILSEGATKHIESATVVKKRITVLLSELKETEYVERT